MGYLPSLKVPPLKTYINYKGKQSLPEASQIPTQPGHRSEYQQEWDMSVCAQTGHNGRTQHYIWNIPAKIHKLNLSLRNHQTDWRSLLRVGCAESSEENKVKEWAEMQVQGTWWYRSVVFQGIYCAFSEGNRLLFVKAFVFFFLLYALVLLNKQDGRRNKPFFLLVTDF